jgi:hypothetical protein
MLHSAAFQRQISQPEHSASRDLFLRYVTPEAVYSLASALSTSTQYCHLSQLLSLLFSMQLVSLTVVVVHNERKVTEDEEEEGVQSGRLLASYCEAYLQWQESLLGDDQGDTEKACIALLTKRLQACELKVNYSLLIFGDNHVFLFPLLLLR